jgi:transposase
MKKKNKILKLWKSGMSKRAIGLKVGVHRSYVQKIIRGATAQGFLKEIFGNTVGGGL